MHCYYICVLIYKKVLIMKNSKLSQTFRTSVPVHIYQHSIDWGIIFYDDVYIIAHFLKLCCLAEKYQIKVFGMCYMLNHIHYLVASQTIENLRLFMQTLTSSFALEYNKHTEHRGSVFPSPFGYAVKNKSKAFRSCHNYIANNAPEKNIVRKAIDYKWNFLEFSKTNHPYSNRIIQKYCSKDFRLFYKEIQTLHDKNIEIKMRRLRHIKNCLDKSEWLQYVDSLISTYNVIDFESSASVFGGLDSMLSAPDDNTGSEYEFNEDTFNYIPFYRYLTILSNRMILCNFSPYALEKQTLKELVNEMKNRTQCTTKHLSLFFHLDEMEIIELLSNQ